MIGLMPRLAGLHVKVDRAVQRAVIRERQGRHAELLRPRDEIGDAGQPVKQAVLAVRVEMNELLDGDLTCRWWEAPRQGPVYCRVGEANTRADERSAAARILRWAAVTW